MLSVALHTDGADCLRRLEVRGHAPSLACAAISALTRTAAALLTAEPALECRGAAPRPGVLRLHVAAVPAQHREWLRGITAMVEQGVYRVAAEYPQHVAVQRMAGGARNLRRA